MKYQVNFSAFSVGGHWGQLILLFLNWLMKLKIYNLLTPCNTWTIRCLVDKTINPATQRTILKIVRFVASVDRTMVQTTNLQLSINLSTNDCNLADPQFWPLRSTYRLHSWESMIKKHVISRRVPNYSEINRSTRIITMLWDIYFLLRNLSLEPS